jgi:hypothetical protein
MQQQIKPETRNIFALVAFTVLLAAGLFFAGESVMAPRKTAQLAVPFESSAAGPAAPTWPL